jgi:hypothetical protein
LVSGLEGLYCIINSCIDEYEADEEVEHEVTPLLSELIVLYIIYIPLSNHAFFSSGPPIHLCQRLGTYITHVLDSHSVKAIYTVILLLL